MQEYFGRGEKRMYLRRYSEKEIEILDEALQELSKVFPVEPSAEKVCDFYVELWDMCAKMSEEKVEYGNQGERGCVIARNVAIRYLHLALMIDSHKSRDGFLLSCLVQSISDTIISIIKLAEDGLEYQAFVMIRTLFELFMTLLIVVESPEKREIYRSAQTPEESYKVWRTDFTKAKFINMLESYSGDYPDLFEPAKVWVTEAYGFLSSFVHNDSLNVMFYTKPCFNEEGISPCSMWGQHVTRKGEIFSRLVEVIAPCDMLFFSMLKDPKIDVSMKTLLVKEEDFPNTINMYWMLDGLRKVCMLLLLEHDSHDKIKKELENADCPFYAGKDPELL